LTDPETGEYAGSRVPPVSVTIRLNGEPHALAAPLTVSELLATLGIDARRVAVEHNLVVVKRAEYGTRRIDDGDEVEIVNFVGGGAGTPGPSPQP
jgi:thiamine biosynthesis protein ThiS